MTKPESVPYFLPGANHETNYLRHVGNYSDQQHCRIRPGPGPGRRHGTARRVCHGYVRFRPSADTARSGRACSVGQPKIPARGTSIDLAYEAAKAAVASCVGKPIGVAIVDKSGQAKLVYIPDGSVTDNAATAMRKANTALLIGAPSNQLYARATADKTLAGKVLNNPSYIIWGGGLPITVNGEVIGAIGVSAAAPRGLTTVVQRQHWTRFRTA